MKKHGFTLIELSIVLVIVALLVAGILVGRELIRAAEIRATINQKEKFDAAVNTFRGKYACLPGDCARATSFGFATNGNGDGRIGADNSCTNNCFSGSTESFTEMDAVWSQLSSVGLITESIAMPASITQPITGINSPKLKLPSRGGWWLFSGIMLLNSYLTQSDSTLLNRHVFWLTGQLLMDDTGAAIIDPVDAFAIDSKMDDGMPMTGSVRATSNHMMDTFNSPAEYLFGAAGSAACINNSSTPNIYNITATTGGLVCENEIFPCGKCGLVMGASF
jgi:prepilin-type N-terminal cleavage/methylation domain-containing protein